MGKQRRRSDLHWRFAEPLNAEQNRVLARRYRASEGAERLAVRDEMIKGNQGLVIRSAERFRSCRLEFEDRVQEGNFGLLRAIELYDPNRQTFATYAKAHIFAAMQRADENNGGTIRVAVWAQRTKRADKQDYVEAGKRARATVSLDALMEWDDGVREFAVAPVEDELAESRERAAKVMQAVESLPEREQTVVRMRYGIGAAPTTGVLIAKELGVTGETVRVICRRAEAALREMPELMAVAS